METKDIKNIQKVDKKILSEFHDHLQQDDFYGACTSYIEYKNCCNGQELDEMAGKLKEHYREKTQQPADK
ncbi:MAG: hypothetical protein ACOC7U_10550, partial [Spirochaetota bacterium]